MTRYGPVVSASTLALFVMTTSATAPGPTQPAEQPEPGRLRELSRTQSYTLGRPFHVRPLPGGRRVLFLRASAESPIADLFAFDPKSERTERLVSARDLLDGEREELSPAEKAARERKRIKTAGITDFSVVSGGDRIVLKLDGQVFLHDLGAERTIRIALPEGVVLTPKPSPDGGKLAFVLDHDLAVIDLPGPLPTGDTWTPDPRFLTDDGTETTPNGIAEFVAQEEMSRHDGFWWAPDGRSLAFQRSDERTLERFAIADAARPEKDVVRFPYPRPGRTNVDVRLFLIDVDGTGRREIAWDRGRFPYVAKVLWQGPLTFLAQARDQRSQVFLRVDTSSGEARPLFEEQDEAWLNIHDSTPRFLSDGRSFLWATEEGGAWRLERKTLAPDGLSIVRREVVVDEEAGFSALVHLDEARGRVWFAGGPDPAQLHLHWAPLDGASPPRVVTEGVGWNEPTFSAQGGVVAINRASLDELPVTSIHPVDEEGRLGPGVPLPDVAERPDALPRVELVEPEDAAGYRAAVVRPASFQAGRSYPVILYVYGGPGHSVVKAHATQWFVQQWMADHGFVVVSLDGRGTPRRGRAFERALRERFHEVPLADQVAGLEALAARFSELDLERVGVYGWSFGGYMAALSVLRRPDVFKAAVAGAPVVDWLYYDTHYTERYLGVPASEDDGVYRSANLITYAPELERPLLLVHGVADDNVYFAHSLQLADALFRAGKPFELVPLVGLTHQLNDPEMREALFARIVDFFGQRLR